MLRITQLQPLTMIRWAALAVIVVAINAMPIPVLWAQGSGGCDEACMEHAVSYCDDGDLCTYSHCFETAQGPSCRYVCAPAELCVF